MNAPPDAPVCTAEEHEEILRLVRLGKLFELIEWVEAGKPTLCPDFEKPRARQSPICEALEHGNHSMVRSPRPHRRPLPATGTATATFTGKGSGEQRS